MRYGRALVWIGLALLWAFLATSLLFVSCSRQVRPSKVERELLDQLTAVYPELGGGLYEEVALWIEVLGEPRTIPETIDGGPHFFYWPDKGIAVGASPIYRNQFRLAPEQRRVTTIAFPLVHEVKPHFASVPDELRIKFDALANFTLDGNSLHALDYQFINRLLVRDKRKPSTHPILGYKITYWPRYFGVFRTTALAVHFEEEEITQLEILDGWLFSDYD